MFWLSVKLILGGRGGGGGGGGDTSLISHGNTGMDSLTPSLPWCHLETADENAKFETHKPFCFLFHTGV